MTDSSTSLTIAAHRPDPYVHLDNRGLMICNGLACALLPAANLRWAAETFDLVADERRATRAQGNHVVGGFVNDDSIVVFAGTRDDIISVGLSRTGFDELRRSLNAR
ncbi:MAG: hypothetical protein QOF04_2334 [Solirubrobacteraceae bacterium]|nr:hypothetical protein [Solirubrobacteraceae bacterium]